MAAKYSSGGSSGASTMRATLVLMLLLGAVVAAHGRPVSCTNKCPKPIKCNGILVDVDATVIVDIDLTVKVDVTDITDVLLSGTYLVPADVTELVVIYVDGYLKVTVGKVLSIVGGLLHTVLGLVLGLFKCYL
ncbi:hypothetical protein M758_3G054500 [Ceratodon purpureus]|uniref:Uncharacterized protein n=1 Tax=Ceratodon purpureus TaxID=3225 RepID=A0A8T0IHJ5_CERPU|nr:hypothetical protein KC19_3G056000 [Ceratodon purpureus]KAG0582390.1 hypothetical protein KC19_3G056100 [Ceratodon purpureus]KAG0582393.1 hypothetical protein KC19_3G056300 [Ceratodon purpureus]KAG0582396.1 hypothetical protein KC19_3G056500 [Ceratodon purpureus]KAG0621866.1 hypothetical protein M758_3G054000 [Ceratodon purpureus]